VQACCAHFAHTNEALTNGHVAEKIYRIAGRKISHVDLAPASKTTFTKEIAFAQNTKSCLSSEITLSCTFPVRQRKAVPRIALNEDLVFLFEKRPNLCPSHSLTERHGD
jgi:hypothetical protein